MVDYFLAEQPVSTSPFMITDENMHRYDPWYAIRNHVYRDARELDLPPIPVPDPRYERDEISTGDYPELNAIFDRLHTDAEGLPYYDPEVNLLLPPPRSPTLSSPELDLAEHRLPAVEAQAERRSEVPYTEAGT